MSVPFTKLDTPIHRLAVVCRGCLEESGEMKNMYEWGLNHDFFNITAIETTRTPGISELLCSSCEAAMLTSKQFRDKCQLSDKILRTSLEAKMKREAQKYQKNHLTCILHDQKLVIMITAPKMDSKIQLPCPFHCNDNFSKKSDLQTHLKKLHNVSDEFEIKLQYYCAEPECNYHITSDKNKWFAGRKFLNQHLNKVHKTKTYYCRECSLSFATETEYHRHGKSCNFVFVCQLCETKYNSNEKLMVHLSRKHPDLHKMYKDGKKAEKRKLESGIVNKRMKVEPPPPTEQEETQTAAETVSGISDWKIEPELLTQVFPKEEKKPVPIITESFASQIPEDVKYDVTLPSWQSKTDFETKTDEISTQTVFEDLLSLKSQNSEDEMFFPESVSLSDIQTQTFPLEFGLSRSHKETQFCKNSQTQSPDLSIKETQTCFCHYDSPKPNFKLFDSLSSSPASLNLTSTETQTGDHRFSVKSDVLLSFNSAETQTCFDDSSNDSM